MSNRLSVSSCLIINMKRKKTSVQNGWRASYVLVFYTLFTPKFWVSVYMIAPGRSMTSGDLFAHDMNHLYRGLACIRSLWTVDDFQKVVRLDLLRFRFSSHSSWERTWTTMTPKPSTTVFMVTTSSSVWRTCGTHGRAQMVYMSFHFISF